MVRRRTVALVVLTAGLAAAGCGGGGGGDGAGGGERLSKDEFVAAADAICKEANAEIDALGEPADFADLGEMTAKVRQISEDNLAKLRALAPPEEIAARVTEALGLIERQIVLMDDLVAAAEAEDVAKLEEIAGQGTDLDVQADAIAKEIGLVECGSGD